MQPRLLRVTRSAAEFAPVFRAARLAGFRIGWLELNGPAEAPETLASATGAGAMRAVSVADGRVIATKALAGEAVLRDLVREHFTGCRLLLVRGEVEAPEIEPSGSEWKVRSSDGSEETLSTEELVANLRKPGYP